MYEICQRLSSRGTLMKIRALSAEGVRRNDCLRLEAVAASRTTEIDLPQGRHNASLRYRLMI